MQIIEREQVVTLVMLNDESGQVWKAMEPLLEQGRTWFVVDLAQVTLLNSVGIAALIAARNKAHANGAKMALANLSNHLKAVFRVLKLERIFALDLDLDAAIRACR